ncbi:MAG TPA: Zn-dependent hydrolase [Gemmatimonadaceae bacterium]|nr:Zn-dependent hydrolase [Gemmatimonadaceae bacterium]
MLRRDFARLASAGLVSALGIPGIRRSFADPLLVNGERLLDQLRALSQYGRNDSGGVSRLAYSESDFEGRAYVTGLMREAGLEVRVDAAGNIIGSRAGSNAALAPVLFGSHIDSVPDGGNFDGTVGSLAAIEAARTMGERGIRTRHPLEVIVFQNEEGGLVGSRALSGELLAEHLTRVSNSGKTLAAGTEFIGGRPGNIASARRARGDVAAYLELHIEQGGTLEREGRHIGIVTGIVGINWWEVAVTGFSNHAGTTPMDQRQDALLASARFIEAVHRIVTSVPGRQVGTVGRIEAKPGAPNVIAGEVRLSLELRDLDPAKVAMLFERIGSEARAIATTTGTRFDFTPSFESLPAVADAAIQRAIADAAAELRITTMEMPSGAGHDAQSIARFAPIGMLFIPSVGGISHSPKELSRPEDVVRGANVLANAVLTLART